MHCVAHGHKTSRSGRKWLKKTCTPAQNSGDVFGQNAIFWKIKFGSTLVCIENIQHIVTRKHVMQNGVRVSRDPQLLFFYGEPIWWCAPYTAAPVKFWQHCRLSKYILIWYEQSRYLLLNKLITFQCVISQVLHQNLPLRRRLTWKISRSSQRPLGQVTGKLHPKGGTALPTKNKHVT